MDSNEYAKLQFDYQQTVDQFKMLADIRFKLLAFVPTLTGAAITVLTETTAPGTALVVGLLGLTATIGITFYEIRNTQLHGYYSKRFKELQLLLNISPEDHPAVSKFRKKTKIGHREGLAIVYGAAFGGWVFVIANAGLKLATLPYYRPPLVLAIFAGFALGAVYLAHSDSK